MCIPDIRWALVHNNDCIYTIYYYVPIYYCRYGVNGIICTSILYSETDETHNFYFDDAIALYSINVLFLNIPIRIHINIIISEHGYVYTRTKYDNIISRY